MNDFANCLKIAGYPVKMFTEIPIKVLKQTGSFQKNCKYLSTFFKKVGPNTKSQVNNLNQQALGIEGDAWENKIFIDVNAIECY